MALHFITIIRLVFRRRYIFMFVNGILLASLFYFSIENSYEEQVFSSLSDKVSSLTTEAKNRDSIILHSMHLTHRLGVSRMELFSNKKGSTITSIINPVTYHLQTNEGACGSYSYILSRLLKEFDIDTRIVQMKVGDNFGGHIIVEAESSKGWVVLDPSYDLVFKRNDGQFASFKDVRDDWNNYRKQVPAGYDTSYAYSDARYTNWNKVPVVMPLIRQVMNWTMGKEKTDVFSIRTLFLEKYKMLFNTTLVIYLLIIFFTLRKYRKRLFIKRISQPATLHHLTGKAV